MSNVKITYRLLVFIAVFIFGIAFSLPSFLQSERGAKINLGLDLQGGLYMLLGVDNKEAVKSKMKSVASSLHYSINKENILIDQFIVKDESLEFSLLDEGDMTKMQALLDEIKGLNVQKDNLHFAVSFTQEELKNIENFALLQAVETIRNRLDEFGLAEPTVAKQGEDKILVELAGIKTKEDELRAKERITKAAHLQLMEVDESKMSKAHTMSEAEAASYGLVVMSDSRNENLKYTLKNIPILDGSMLTDARVGFSDTSTYPVINFTLNSEGAKKFADYTGANVGKRLAIVLDNKVYSAPSINERIGGGSGQISGAFTQEEARDVAVALRSGALLAPVKLLEQRSIGPSLGADSIKMSMIALIGASVFIIVFMMLYYGVAGVFANIAMLVNVLVVVAVMAMFGATLTLPGMAGLVLTVGMAVDANVIINERIRELLRDGAKIRASVEQGYKNAMSAIIDANITSLVTSVALYAYGTGAVKGFAVTLGIGIVVSMITAIWGTHGMFDYFMNKMEKSNNTKFWFGYKRKI
ncbi:protein translocase subunit SecD [Campylobacter upsaliensis]|uniref:protein translocase subunit SecD n=1 Tax=Campylobacter upsaliensis TaxID=28080 RepID=UPI00126DAA7C|nr:protein translocase subunit SecD [Campylobacter upsaliensis]EAI8428907.1 protein translocase subunit SecD [Campylobacter upsaliensis]EAJ7109773.1 protein translocase subunit SecD [Campylobacter upsaliensis]EAK6956287.1 protein translocase subunit SecD [Campylobacter upsaliensis]EHB2692009.1 protein translocase subunit SecD [Campylobacter upsaliensis]ELM7301694.1 protein translocase subunit SecD [Campylobacter upsaliensis]